MYYQLSRLALYAWLIVSRTGWPGAVGVAAFVVVAVVAGVTVGLLAGAAAGLLTYGMTKSST